MNNNKNNIYGHFLALFTVLVWGTTFISTKVLLKDFQPIEILFFRFVLGYLALLIVYPRIVKTKSLKEELYFIGAGITGVTVYFLFENIALTYSFASNVAIILSVTPFLTAIVAHFMKDGERLTRSFFLGFLLAILGIAIIEFNGSIILKLNPIGDMLALLAGVAWAFYSNIMKKIGALHLNNFGATRKVFFYGLLFMVPALFVFEFKLGLDRFNNFINMSNVLYLGFGASAICFATWNWAVKVLGVLRTSIYIYIVPIITVVASVIILHEKITVFAVIGTVITLSGLVLSNKQ